MKVRIVWNNPGGDRILDRLARALAEYTGWPLATSPDRSADINYNLLYIDVAQRFPDWRHIRWAAYFSHYEPDTPYKRKWWNDAQWIPIKTVTARQYLTLQGAYLVTPPVDDCFSPSAERRSGAITVGVSGFVDRSGRKGERLLSDLVRKMPDVNWVASGEGWPVRITNVGLAGLPAWYHTLDIYLCTSTIEGIPMPPFEALASGVPVVIPRGVGRLDDLPDIPGITRYIAGDVDDCRRALSEAVIGCRGVDRAALADVIRSTYTAQAWAQSHVAAFTRALQGGNDNGGGAAESVVDAPEAVDRSLVRTTRRRKAGAAADRGRGGKRGAYYVAYGAPSRRCAEAAIAAFKNHFPEIPVAVVSDSPLGCEDVFIEHPDLDIGGRLAKVKIYDLAPADWEYICYMDADTEVIAREDLLWRLVEDGWDMAICRNPGRFHIVSQMRRPDNADECEYTFGILGGDQFLQYNGGVFSFRRNERTAAFFRAWHSEWLRFGKRDQGALLRALWSHPVRMYILGNEWNTITRYAAAEDAAWLLHYPMTARRWDGVVHYRLDDPNAWKHVRK